MNNDVCADTYNNYDFSCFDYLFMLAYDMPLNFAESNTLYIGESKEGPWPSCSKNNWKTAEEKLQYRLALSFFMYFKPFSRL